MSQTTQTATARTEAEYPSDSALARDPTRHRRFHKSVMSRRSTTRAMLVTIDGTPATVRHAARDIADAHEGVGWVQTHVEAPYSITVEADGRESAERAMWVGIVGHSMNVDSTTESDDGGFTIKFSLN
jgi:hypothetical protein